MLKSKKFWGFLTSFFFLWLALRKVDWQELPSIIKSIHPIYLLAMVISSTVEHLVRTIRWRFILRNRIIPLKNLYCGLILGYLFNNLFPARAGEFIRALYLGRKGFVPTSEAFGSIVLERLLDGFVIVAFIVFTLNNFSVSNLLRNAGFSALLFYSVVLLALLILHHHRSYLIYVNRLSNRILPAGFQERFERIQVSFLSGISLIGSPGPFFGALAVSFLAWGISLSTYVLAFKVFGLPHGFSDGTLLITALSMGAMIPSSPGMIGIFQYVCILILSGMFHHSREVAISFGILIHSLGYCYILVVGFLVMVHENLSFRELEEPAEKAQEGGLPIGL